MSKTSVNKIIGTHVNRIIDTHVHLWDTTVLNYPWLNALQAPTQQAPTQKSPSLPATALPADFIAATHEVTHTATHAATHETTPEATHAVTHAATHAVTHSATHEATPESEIIGVVLVQAECDPQQAEEEVRWLTKQSERFAQQSEFFMPQGEMPQGKHRAPSVAIVAYAPLESSTVRPLLERYAENNLITGVRRNIQDEPAGFAQQISANVKALAELDLSFDICARAHQLADVIDLVDSATDTNFVLDHLGKPTITPGVPAGTVPAGTVSAGTVPAGTHKWRTHLHELGKRPNVACKLSGLATEASYDWTISDLSPYISTALDAFGPERVIFGSDWPVCTMATTYGATTYGRASTYDKWLATVLAAIPPELHDQALRTNAMAIYDIPALGNSPALSNSPVLSNNQRLGSKHG